MTDSNARGAPVSVSRWGELPFEKPVRGYVLRVLVGGQVAGSFRWEDGTWRAIHQGRVLGPYRQTEHASAAEALRAVLRSGFARRLGARAASRVYWTDRGRRCRELAEAKARRLVVRRPEKPEEESDGAR
jgi:hypothetical protein